MPGNRTQDRDQSQTRDLRARRRIAALLEQLIIVFQKAVDTSQAAAQVQPRSFAATLPRYEFKNKSIFPDFEQAQSDTPLSPLQAWAELRTVLDEIAIELDASGATAAAAFLRVLDGYSLPVPVSPRIATPRALPKSTS